MKPITASLWPFKRPELREAPISIDASDAVVFDVGIFSKTPPPIFSRRYSRFLTGLPGSDFSRADAYADELTTKEIFVDNFNPIFEFDQGDLGDAAFQHSLRGNYEGQNSIAL